jgi:hypothetical protein
MRPGLNMEPKVPSITALAATAGDIPCEMSRGIKITPTEAAHPAALGKAILMQKVAMAAPGIIRKRTLESQLVSP